MPFGIGKKNYKSMWDNAVQFFKKEEYHKCLGRFVELAQRLREKRNEVLEKLKQDPNTKITEEVYDQAIYTLERLTSEKDAKAKHEELLGEIDGMHDTMALILDKVA